MKFESLNNSKYSLTPEKMGQLVGGQKVVKNSPEGTYKLGAGHTVTCCSDVMTFANERDAKYGYIQSVEFYDCDGNLILKA